MRQSIYLRESFKGTPTTVEERTKTTAAMEALIPPATARIKHSTTPHQINRKHHTKGLFTSLPIAQNTCLAPTRKSKTYKRHFKNCCLEHPWWCSGWESACRGRGHGFDPWSGKIPHTTDTTATEAHTP